MKPIVTDLTKTEGDPTTQAEVLVDRESTKGTVRVPLIPNRPSRTSASTWFRVRIAAVVTLISIPNLAAFVIAGLRTAAPRWLIAATACILVVITGGLGAWVVGRLGRASGHGGAIAVRSSRRRRR